MSQEFEAQAPKKESSLKKDLYNIIFLHYMYFLQGLPLGLAFSVSIILASSKSSFSDQGTFSFAFYPFSIKLLWAPIVDTVYFKRVGRRKTWILMAQALLCLFMFSTANYVQKQLENSRQTSGKFNSIKDFGLLILHYKIFLKRDLSNN